MELWAKSPHRPTGNPRQCSQHRSLLRRGSHVRFVPGAPEIKHLAQVRRVRSVPFPVTVPASTAKPCHDCGTLADRAVTPRPLRPERRQPRRPRADPGRRPGVDEQERVRHGRPPRSAQRSRPPRSAAPGAPARARPTAPARGQRGRRTPSALSTSPAMRRLTWTSIPSTRSTGRRLRGSLPCQLTRCTAARRTAAKRLTWR